MKQAIIEIVGSKCCIVDADNRASRKKFSEILEMVQYVKSRGIEVTNPWALSMNYRKMLENE
jgi:hypothetical protein